MAIALSLLDVGKRTHMNDLGPLSAGSLTAERAFGMFSQCPGHNRSLFPHCSMSQHPGERILHVHCIALLALSNRIAVESTPNFRECGLLRGESTLLLGIHESLGELALEKCPSVSTCKVNPSCFTHLVPDVFHALAAPTAYHSFQCFHDFS